ncbi:MAG: glycoside hydrolase family 16 protein, partial [Bacteroidota bacterium]
IFGPNCAVKVLNGILKRNLKTSIDLGFGVDTPPNPIIKQGWINIFNDDFNGSNLDLTKWKTNPHWLIPTAPFHPGNIKNNNEAPTHYYDASCISVVNDKLVITTDYTPQTFHFVDWDGQDYGHWDVSYKTGWIQTLDRYKYGYFEIRSKMPKSKGQWPAFWLAGDPWPPEIDIYEIYTSKFDNRFESNYHWGIEGDEDFPHESDVGRHYINNSTEEFHIYGCEWNECFIKWYYDNLLVRVAYKNVDLINIDMEVIVSSAIHDFENNLGSDGTYPNNYEVDYVRIYER